jgi:uncharacterized membrane protein required for colicin V production
MWGLIIDGLVIGIILIFAIIGIVKGFFDSLLSLIGTALAIVAGVFTAKYVSGWINSLFSLEDKILNSLDGGAEGSFKIFGGEFSNPEVARFAVWLISVVAIFLLVKLVLLILSKMFEKVTQNAPVISGINRVLGMVFGVVKGVVIVAGCLAVLSLLSQISVIGKPIQDAHDTTTIAKPVYNYVDDLLEKTLDKDTIQDIIDRIISDNTPAETPEEEGSAETVTTQRPVQNVEALELTYTQL